MIAGDQQEGMSASCPVGAPRGQSVASDFASTIYVVRRYQGQRRAKWDENIQVDDGSVFPQKPVVEPIIEVAVTEEGITHNLGLVIYGLCPAEAVTVDRPKIEGFAFLPKISVKAGATRSRAGPPSVPKSLNW